LPTVTFFKALWGVCPLRKIKKAQARGLLQAHSLTPFSEGPGTLGLILFLFTIIAFLFYHLIVG